MPVLKRLYAQYSFFYPAWYKQAYYTFRFSFLLVKMEDSYEDSTSLLDIQHLFQENIAYYYLQNNFL